jgi:hypothetical protein
MMARSQERGAAVDRYPLLFDQRPAFVGLRRDDGPTFRRHSGSLPELVGLAWPESCRGDRS